MVIKYDATSSRSCCFAANKINVDYFKGSTYWNSPGSRSTSVFRRALEVANFAVLSHRLNVKAHNTPLVALLCDVQREVG